MKSKNLRDAAYALLQVVPAGESKMAEAWYDLSEQIDLWDKAHGPQHSHDCATCIFLGRKDNIDLYICNLQDDCKMASILGRYGNELNEYYSSLVPFCFAGPTEHLHDAHGWYHAALREAMDRKVFSDRMTDDIERLYEGVNAKYKIDPTWWVELGAVDRMSQVKLDGSLLINRRLLRSLFGR